METTIKFTSWKKKTEIFHRKVFILKQMKKGKMRFNLQKYGVDYMILTVDAIH